MLADAHIFSTKEPAFFTNHGLLASPETLAATGNSKRGMRVTPKRKRSGRMRSLSRKQVAAWPLVSSSLTASARDKRAHGPTGRRLLRTQEIRVRFPVSPLSVPWSNGTTPGSHPGNSGSTPLGTTCPGTPTAERFGLNPSGCRFKSCSGHWSQKQSWLGRQSADHLGLEPGMLWVRLPPEPLNISVYLSSWSSLECSPVCQAGDRGFKSRRGRLSEYGTVRKPVKRPSSNQQLSPPSD